MPHNDASQRRPYLQDLLDASAIPYTSIQVVDINAAPPVVDIVYADAATQQQKDAGAAILAAFDWRARRPLAIATVFSTLNNALTAQQRNNLLTIVVAEFLLDNPRLAAKLANQLAINGVAVDEVDPS